MKYLFLVLALLVLPITYGYDVNVSEQVFFQANIPMSDNCIKEYNQAFGRDVTVIMKEYCDSMSGSALYLLGISLLILLFQPLVQKKSVFFGGMVKLLGFGLIVLVMIMLYYRM
jgi:hypothetical protein